MKLIVDPPMTIATVDLIEAAPEIFVVSASDKVLFDNNKMRDISNLWYQTKGNKTIELTVKYKDDTLETPAFKTSSNTAKQKTFIETSISIGTVIIVLGFLVKYHSIVELSAIELNSHTNSFHKLIFNVYNI